MSKHRISSRRVCPFYKYETAQRISCMGFQDNVTIHMGFANRIDCINHKETYCSKDPEGCPFYKVRRET